MSRKFIAILTASVASLSINCGVYGASSGPNVDERVSGHQTVKDRSGHEKMMKRDGIEEAPFAGDNLGELFLVTHDQPPDEFLPPQQ